MLNIEVIRFEAQDVITASTAAPAEPVCICGATGTHGYNNKTGVHKVYTDNEGSYVVCDAKDHNCGY